MEIRPRFFTVPEHSFFLFGPRGTGKTTWLQQELPEALHLDLLRPDLYRELSARPERLSELVLGSPRKRTVVLDEVQRVPELLNVVHDLIERKLDRRFVLTGSSARKLRRGGVDLLAGRALLRTMHPFMAAELPDFRLDHALHHGLLPLVLSASDPVDTLRAYASLYLQQEVQLEGWTRRVGDFARFLEAVSFSHAALLNISNVARECQVKRKTVAGYISILEDLLLSYRVPIFTRRARRQTSAHPKFFLFDAGVYRALRPRGPLDRPQEIEGCALEGLVAQHLRAWIAYSSGECELFYWRTRAGLEVDLIIYGADGFGAVEVKNTGRIRPEDLRALRAFLADYPEAEAFCLYRGGERLRVDEIWCLPVEEFLRRLKPGQSLSAVL